MQEKLKFFNYGTTAYKKKSLSNGDSCQQVFPNTPRIYL